MGLRCPAVHLDCLWRRLLQELAKSDPAAFICHFYNFYFAHTAGGKMIGARVRPLQPTYIAWNLWFLDQGASHGWQQPHILMTPTDHAVGKLSGRSMHPFASQSCCFLIATTWQGWEVILECTAVSCAAMG